MASPVQISSYATSISADSSADLLRKDRPSRATKTATRKGASTSASEQLDEQAIPAIIAHSLEFVALPGRAEGIQIEIPTAMRHAFRDTEGFVGSMVLVSEQEARLVTVITLWTGANRLALCGECETRLRRWLAPYVDRSLRTRRFASYVATPDRFTSKTDPRAPTTGRENSVHLQ